MLKTEKKRKRINNNKKYSKRKTRRISNYDDNERNICSSCA